MVNQSDGTVCENNNWGRLLTKSSARELEDRAKRLGLTCNIKPSKKLYKTANEVGLAAVKVSEASSMVLMV